MNSCDSVLHLCTCIEANPFTRITRRHIRKVPIKRLSLKKKMLEHLRMNCGKRERRGAFEDLEKKRSLRGDILAEVVNTACARTLRVPQKRHTEGEKQCREWMKRQVSAIRNYLFSQPLMKSHFLRLARPLVARLQVLPVPNNSSLNVQISSFSILKHLGNLFSKWFIREKRKKN